MTKLTSTVSVICYIHMTSLSAMKNLEETLHVISVGLNCVQCWYRVTRNITRCRPNGT